MVWSARRWLLASRWAQVDNVVGPTASKASETGGLQGSLNPGPRSTQA